MASILLVGPGAIGATLAAWLAQDDRHRITVAVRTPFDSIEVQTPGGVIRASPRVITEAHQAEEIIASRKADLVAIARAMLYDPRWPWHAAAELNAKVDGPPQYWRAPPNRYRDIFNHITFGAR